MRTLFRWPRIATLTLALTALLAAASPPPVHASLYGPTVSVSYFYDDLAPYGRWVDVPGYGWCWSPEVSGGWRPYCYGSWEYTDAGWAWDSDEPWGWAVFHYGSWLDDPFYGWIWVPGTVWGPAWVAWRVDAYDIGWAPLPPGVSWSATFGLSGGSNAEFIPAQRWCFVERRHFVDRGVNARLFPVERNRALIAHAPLRLDYSTRNGRPFNRGEDVARIERTVGRPVQRMRIEDASAPVRGPGARADGRVGFFRPDVHKAQWGEMPRPGRGRAGRFTQPTGGNEGSRMSPRMEQLAPQRADQQRTYRPRINESPQRRESPRPVTERAPGERWNAAPQARLETPPRRQWQTPPQPPARVEAPQRGRWDAPQSGYQPPQRGRPEALPRRDYNPSRQRGPQANARPMQQRDDREKQRGRHGKGG